MTEMSGADMVVQALVDLGVDTVFGYPGGAVLPIYDALYKHPTIKHILVRHEQAATHAAEGYARSTGKPGVVLVTSGPGATNAVTGITDALLDSIPMVVLTGQVPTTLIGTDAFQECDTVGITRHCTKHNYLVMDPDRLGAIIHEAFHIATHGRPGPVVIDIPKNVQVATGDYVVPEKIAHKSYRPQVRGRAPGFLHRRRRDQRRPRRQRRLAPARVADRRADHLDPDGARRLPVGRSEVARYARHARHL